MSSSCRVRAFVAALAILAPTTAQTQAVIKVNDSTSIRFGFLGQLWADFQQNVRQDTSFAQSIFFRRMRFIASAQVGSKLSIFFQTDDPNLGRAAPGFNKNLGTQNFIIQDAYLELKPASAPFWIEGGLLLIPLCRNCYASAASLLPIDYGAYSFLASGATGSVNGRDGGLMVKGTVADQHVEYRAGIFTGARSTIGTPPNQTTLGSNSMRGAGHLMVNFLETEVPGYVLPGTYLGRRKVFNVGAGFDVQSVYKAYAADAFLSYPLGPDGVTLATTFIHYDGNTFIAVPRENTFEVEGGYHLTDAKITPWAKFETRNIDAQVQTATAQNEHRLQLGGTYYWVGQTLNVKAAYNRYTFKVLNSSELTQNGFTVQLQAFYY